MWGRKPNPETEKEKGEMEVVKRRLSRVEARLRMLSAQVSVLRREDEKDDA